MTISAEQYASRVEAALVRELKRAGGRSIESMPSPDDAARLLIDVNVARSDDNPMAEHVGPVWSGARTRDALGLRTRQALSSRRSNGTVLGVSTREGSVYYPIFQFRRHGDGAEVHPGLVPVLKTLKDVEPWTVAAMLQAKDPDLGASAVDWVRSGRSLARLEEWARTVKHELTVR